jgi:two-component system phosphate regulon sensor histidine kinase PhoR
VSPRRHPIQHVLPYLLILFLALLVVLSITGRTLWQAQQQSAAGGLRAQLEVARATMHAPITEGDWGAVDSLCKALGRSSPARVIVLRRDGQLCGDSRDAAGGIDWQSARARPEIRRALEGEPGEALRFDPDRRMDLVYVALPVRTEVRGRMKVPAVIWGAQPMADFPPALRRVQVEIILGLGMIGVVFLLVALHVLRRLRSSIEELRRGAEGFARGELDRGLPVSEIEEVGGLARALNRMAAELDTRIRTITSQRNESQAILLSMIEGVLVVDPRGRIASVNVACGQMLGVNPEAIRGRRIQEVLRNPHLQGLIERVLSESETVEGEILLHNGEERFLQVHGTVLRDAGGHGAGAVLVLNDVTRLRELERVRQDFVANVTHELKTPITSIKAAAETLLGGAIDEPDDAERFVAIVARQASRLNAIIEDLLSLSRIEAESGRAGIQASDQPLEPTLAGAIQTCAARAAEKEIAIEMSCDPRLRAPVNPALLENALVNLIDNAIKYSEKQTRIRVAAYEHGDEVAIDVADQGCGIDKRHHQRIFERFYLVDKARSRSLGGTGLGLAIVKHVVRAHGGRVAVESAPGDGSVFSIILPRGLPPGGPPSG